MSVFTVGGWEEAGGDEGDEDEDEATGLGESRQGWAL